MARCASLYDTISSQELQLQSLLSQAAAEKSSFIQEKEQLQLLFDKQQHMCVSLTAQVVALTASCERLQRQVDHHTLQHQHEKDQYIKEMESQYANIALDKQTCLEAASRAQSLEALCNDAQSQLASLQSSHLEQAQRIALMAEQLMKHEHDALLNQVYITTLFCTAIAVLLQFRVLKPAPSPSPPFCFKFLVQELVLSRRTRGCQTLSADDLERSSFDSKMDAAKCAVHQLRADCNQVLMQFSRDLHAERAQASIMTCSRFALIERVLMHGFRSPCCNTLFLRKTKPWSVLLPPRSSVQPSVSNRLNSRCCHFSLMPIYIHITANFTLQSTHPLSLPQLHECSSDLLLQSGARSRALGEAQEQLELSRRLHAQVRIALLCFSSHMQLALCNKCFRLSLRCNY